MKADEVLRSIEAEATVRGLPIIGPGRGAYLDELVVRHRPKRVLEVGTLVGYSAIRMARLLPRGGSMTCVEIDPTFARLAESNISKAGLSNRVRVIVGDALRVVPKLTGKYDLVFLDAEKQRYLAYLRACERLLRPGSVVVADNVKSFASEVADYLNRVRNSGLYASAYREGRAMGRRSGTDAIEISVRK